MTTMKLLLLHGRGDPEQDLNDWGYGGPTLEGVRALHVTYLSTYALYFDTPEQAEEAQRLTGWRPWNRDAGNRPIALEMPFHNELLHTDPPECKTRYFGDWELQTKDGAAPADKPVAQNIFTFEVEGRGRFPTDMLRFDNCWPFSENDSRTIEVEHDRRRVKLNSAASQITPKRWESFLWKVVEKGD